MKTLSFIVACSLLWSSFNSSIAVPSNRCMAADKAVETSIRFDVWAEIPENFDPDKPVVRIRYVYVAGTDSVDLQLPKNERQMHYFKDFVVYADGQRLPLVDEKIMTADPAFGRRETLKPKQSAEILVPIYEIYRIPPTWKVLEIAPSRTQVLAKGFTGSARVSNGPATHEGEVIK